MKMAVLGAGGGLGRNVVDAALREGHAVTALVRDPSRAKLPAAVNVVVGDAGNAADLSAAMEGTDATLFCVNPPLASWLETFPPLLTAVIAAAARTGSRLVFPANVWIYGPGHAGELVDETRTPSPTSERGALRLRMEEQIRSANIHYALARLPEFYGPSVTTLTPRVFQAALAGKRTVWPGRLDVEVELVYMPDAARCLVAIASAPDCDAEVFHLPGAHTTPRKFAERVYAAAGTTPKVTGVSGWPLRAAGLFDSTIASVADIGHLWTDPILLDGTKYRARFGELPITPLEEGIATTLAWQRTQ
jgi:nucleoside-diphosphate-sugar epimerase